MTSVMPTISKLQKAHEEFKKIEPRDFFYWSVSKLVESVLQSKPLVLNDLVRSLMMLLTTWNKNYYRFIETRDPDWTLEKHFAELEGVISKYFESLMRFRRQKIQDTSSIPEDEIQKTFKDFTTVLGRVGAAKCLHLLAPTFFPLWDAAILKGF